MAQVPFCSAKVVLAKLARNVGGKLPSMYINDILEWLPEGIDLLSSTKTLERTSTGNQNCPGELKVKNHVVCLPKDMYALLAVEDENGRRIRHGGDETDIASPSKRYAYNNPTEKIARATVFAVNPLDHQTSDGTPTTKPGTTIPIYGEDLQQINATSTNAYYIISGNYLQTSFEEGFVKIHYLRRPLDKEGYPLIPQNQNFETALYWYVLKMMIGAGYKHQVFTYEQCDEYFEKFAARAINEIQYPSVDEVAAMNSSLIRLIPPFHFYEDFFVNSEQVQQIRK